MENIIRLFEGCFKKFLYSRKSLPPLGLLSIFPQLNKVDLHLPAEDVISSFNDLMVIPLEEMLTLASVCSSLRPFKVFEIGTYRGLSALIMAMNTPETTQIFTLDIKPNESSTGQDTKTNDSLKYELGECYKKSSYVHKITQLHGDSRAFDFSPYYGQMDLVFIDGNHTYEFVKSDSEQAFKLIRPGGAIIWDDYLWRVEYPACSGVSIYLHEKSLSKKTYHIDGTRLAIYIDSK